MKENLKILGSEALYLLATVIVAGLAALLQTLGRTYEGKYSGFLFTGDEYSYNILFYILGIVIFVGFMVLGYRFFLSKRLTELYRTGAAIKIFFFVVAVLFALLMLAAIVFCLFLLLGMNDNMRPVWMENITGFGWPIFSLAFMLYIELKESNA